MTGPKPPLSASVFQLTKALPACPAFHRIYRVAQGWPRAVATPQLEEKYGVAQNNVQHVLSITDVVAQTQCWYNEARTQKPQSFSVDSSGPLDPTDGGRTCDFCRWQQLTAADTWGRAEREHAVSASNLFKYVAPAQGVILFKHHDPLQFSLEQLSDLLSVAGEWFDRAEAAAGTDEAAAVAASSGAGGGDAAAAAPCLHPLLVWNCLQRAGASQYHGHAQVMLSSQPFPDIAAAAAAEEAYRQRHGASYASDQREAHASIGLLWRARGPAPGDTAYALPSLAPRKDCEMIVQSGPRGLACPAFQLLLFACMRALIDELGVQTWNAAISFEDVLNGAPAPCSRGGGSNSSSADRSSSSSRGGGAASGPCTARLVSRGKLSSPASDFGGLEVFGGASIAHTDPVAVGAAIDRVLHRLGCASGGVRAQRVAN